MQGQGRAPLSPADTRTADSAAAETSPSRPVATLLLAAVATLVVVLDVVTKVVVVAALSDGREHTLIPKVLDLELTRNSGAAFSLGTGSTVVFTLVAAVVVVAIARSARRLVSRGWAISLGLLLGGALGNLIDRLVRAPGPGRGAVVDWIHLHHWPVFNAADSAIVVGAVLAAVLSIRGTAMTATPAVPAAAGEGDSDE